MHQTQPYFLAGKLVSLLIEEHAYEMGMHIAPIERELAIQLNDVASFEMGHTLWGDLLSAFNRLARIYSIYDNRGISAYEFCRVLNRVRLAAAYSVPVVSMLWDSRSQSLQYGADRDVPEARYLEPLIPVIPILGMAWSERYPGKSIELVADEHSALTEGNRDLITGVSRATGDKLESIVLADSKHDPRVQLADLLAGTGRWAAEQVQHGGSTRLSRAAVRHFTPRGLWSPKSPIEFAVQKSLNGESV